MKKLIYLLGILLACSFNNMIKAQVGSSCSNPIVLPANSSSLTDSVPADSVRWYSIVANSNDLGFFVIDLPVSGGHIQKICLYDSCSGLPVAQDSVINPSQDTLTLFDTLLTKGNTYYIELLNNVTGGSALYTLRSLNTPIVGNDLSQVLYSNTLCGLNYAYSSVPLNGRWNPTIVTAKAGQTQPVNMSISGMPTSDVIIKQAYVIYTVVNIDVFKYKPTFNFTPAGPGAPTTLVTAGVLGSSPGATAWNQNLAPTPCYVYPASAYDYQNWFNDNNNTYSYYADVTSLVNNCTTAPNYNGNYIIDGSNASGPNQGLIPFNCHNAPPFGSGPEYDVDGVTLIIIYQQNCATYQGTFVLQGGLNEGPPSFKGGIVKSVNLPSPVPSGTLSAQNGLLVTGDAENENYDYYALNYDLNANNPPKPDAYLFNNANHNPAEIWNTVQQSPNPSYSTSQTTVPFSLYTTGDAIDMVAIGAYYAQTDNACNSVSIGPQNPFICSGGSTTLTASGYAITNYSWSPAAGLSCTSCPNPVASPTATTTYTVTATSSVGCSSSATVTVNVANITINGPSAICAVPCYNCIPTQMASHTPISGGYNLQFTLSTSGFPCGSPSSYSWSNNCVGSVITSGNNTNTYNLFVPQGDNSDIYDGFNVFVTVCCPGTNGFCCTQEFHVDGCCLEPCPEMADPIFSGNASDLASLNLQKTNQGTNSPGTGGWNTLPAPNFNYVVDSVNNSGQPTWYIEDVNTPGNYCGHLIINGLVSVNKNLVIRNSEIQMGPDAKFVLAPGVTMTVENSHLYAADCGLGMWRGIFVPRNSELDVIQGSLIEDAKEAIVSEGGGNYKVNQSTLNKDHWGIYVEPFNGGHQGTITASQISCNPITSPLPPYNGSNNVTLGTIPPVVTLLAPYAGARTSIGMIIDSVASITIGNNTTASPADINTFENMDYGINSNASSITVVHNDFNDYPPAAASVGFVGVYAKGDATGTKTATIGIRYPNSFEGWGSFYGGQFGIWVRDTINATIKNNTMNNNFVGMGVMGTWRNNISIENNQINTFPVEGVVCYGNLGSNIYISGNTFTNTAAQPHAIGVYVNGYAFSFYTVATNQMNSMGTGIFAQNTSWASIKNNQITLLNTGYPGANEGIELADCQSATVDHNTVTALGTPNIQDGIFSNFSYINLKETCNNLNSTNNGCTFIGLNLNSFFAQNQMSNNSNAGLLLNTVGIIGPQGNNSGSVNDNQWLGTFSGPPWASISDNSPGTFSPFYVRSTGTQYGPTANILIGVGALIPFNVPTGGPIVSAYDCIGGSGSGSGISSATALQIIDDSIPYGEYVNSSRGQSKYALYRYLNTVDSSLLSVPAIRLFHDSVRNANIGKLDSMFILMDDTNGVSAADISRATALNALIASPDTIEQTLQTVENIVIAMQSAGTNFPNASQITTLKTIAPLCPALYGSGVFMARALLSAVDSTQYISSCEVPVNAGDSNARIMHSKTINNSEIKASVYPNPANSMLNVLVQLAKGQTANICLFNSLGEQVRCVQLTNSLSTIPVADLSQGIYMYRITDMHGNLIKQDKVMLVH